MVNEDKLIKRLSKMINKRFWENAIVGFVTLVIVFIMSMVSILEFKEGTEELWVVIGCIVIFIVIIIVSIIGLRPFIKDIKFIKLHKTKKIIGKVIKYRKVVHGGDPTTESYYPTIRDIDKGWIEVEVRADNTEFNRIYYCVYLPNTKLAICEEVQNLNKT